MDKQGRIGIQASLREYAGLDRDVVVIGVMDRIEIWDPAKWREYSAGAQASSPSSTSSPTPAAELAPPAPHEQQHDTTAQRSAGTGLRARSRAIWDTFPVPDGAPHLGHLPRFQMALPRERAGTWSGGSPSFSTGAPQSAAAVTSRAVPRGREPAGRAEGRGRSDEHRARGGHAAGGRVGGPAAPGPPPAREAATVMAFSAATSVGGRRGVPAPRSSGATGLT